MTYNTMKQLLLALLMAFFASACATRAQLYELKDATEARLDGSITQKEYEAANAKWEAEMEAQRIAQEEAAVGLGELLTGGAGVVAGLYGVYRQTKKDAVLQVHHERDQKYVEKNVDAALDGTA